VIDLHSHILHRLDDGPESLEGSLEFARAAVDAGTEIIVATPHIRDDYPFPLDAIEERRAELTEALTEEGIELTVVAGGEVSLAKSADLSQADLESVAIGDGPYVLVESPYSAATDFLEYALHGVLGRGLTPILAHPERSPSLQKDMDRIAEIVDAGVLCSITAGSMSGAFGRSARRAAIDMLAAGLVHNIASDAHAAVGRPPAVLPSFDDAEEDLPGIRRQAFWLTSVVPAAVVAGAGLPPGAEPAGGGLARRRGLRRR
jgi:protein-tyrosine phosphatase